jgi:prepilin-type N-terminal cleavage/methylation domain-containing protein
MKAAASQSPAATRCGLTLIECVMSMLLLSIVMVGALGAIAGARKMQTVISDRVLGQQLAMGLMQEILDQAYQESDDAVLFGPEGAEITGGRPLYDDVDDYNGLVDSPPADQNGNPLPGFAGWSRQVIVEWADPVTFQTTTTANTQLKRITLTVAHAGKTVATLFSYRSIAWTDQIPTPDDATGNHPPIAVATGTNLVKRTSTTATFSASTSSDPDGDTLSYVWNFGDGTSAVGATASHYYGTVGNYTVTLYVYDGHGGAATVTLTVSVTP